MLRRLIIILGLALLGWGGVAGEIFYPWRTGFAGALDGGAWPGIVLVAGRDAAFAFTLRVEREGTTAESEDFYYLVSEVGPNSPDGQYARVRFDLGLPFGKKSETPILMKPAPRNRVLTVEWSRRDETTILGRILCPPEVRVTIVHYRPWDFRGAYEVRDDGAVLGRSDGPARSHYLFWTDRPGERDSDPARPGLRFDSEDERDLYFVCGTGESERGVSDRLARYRNREAIADLLDEEAVAYEKKRVRIEGLHEGVAEAVTNNIFWMVLYQPGEHRLYTPAGRGWIFRRPDGAPDGWQIFEWDSFFNALQLAVESAHLARDAVTAVLKTQYPNGNIPNWRSRTGGTPDRSQPPVGAYVVLKLFQRLGDAELLKEAYPYLERWHAFWTARSAAGRLRRDGNGDGLLEWGSDTGLVAAEVPAWEKGADGRQRAAWESGQDDLPNWDEASWSEAAGTLTMNCVDLNSLFALDAWCLSQIADRLDKPEAAAGYAAEYEKIKALVNARLWNEKEGFYCDRHWDGRFSPHRAASNFLPLLARIPEERQARRMIQRLLDPKEFWGEYVIPTISRSDPAFKSENQQYWRGTIWPPTNYLVYQGLKAYGFDAVAAEFARKSADLFMRSWSAFQLCPENFDSLTGEAGGQRHQSWGPLFVLTALEEYLDFTPWEGFRFGMLKPQRSGRLTGLAIQGRHYEVEVAGGRTILREEGRDIVRADGPAVFRRFLYAERETSFEVKSLAPRKVTVRLLRKGKHQLLLDGREVEVFEGQQAVCRIPEGEHAILIQLLDSLDRD